MNFDDMSREELLSEIKALKDEVVRLEKVVQNTECIHYSLNDHELKSDEKSKCRYRFLVENIPDVVWTSDSDGNVIFASSDIEELCGFSPEDFYTSGVNLWRDRAHADDIERVKEAYQQLFTKNKVFDVEYRIKCKNDKWKWVHDKAIYTYKENDITYADGITTDITSRKEIEDALHYRLMIEELVTNISSRFINIASCNIDKEINDALMDIGKFVGIDRCYVYLLDSDGNKIKHFYEWRDEDVEAYISEGMSLAPFAWIMGKLRQFEDIYVPRVSELPDEAKSEKDIWTENEFQSILAIPLVLNNNLVGFFGFNSEKAEKQWNQEDISLLRLIGEIIVNMVERKQSEAVLQKESRFDSW